MPNKKNKLYIYEALELRGEYKSRIKTLKKLLPEGANNNMRFGASSSRYEPVESLDVKKVREDIKTLEYKLRKLNNALQLANFQNKIEADGEKISIADALSLRKSTNENIKNKTNQLQNAAYKKVIYKENRNIEETSDLNYKEIKKQLEKERLLFRELNRKLRDVSFKIVIDFKDEE
jgi:predicted ATP-dependent endonuclease of OLD family